MHFMFYFHFILLIFTWIFPHFDFFSAFLHNFTFYFILVIFFIQFSPIASETLFFKYFFYIFLVWSLLTFISIIFINFLSFPPIQSSAFTNPNENLLCCIYSITVIMVSIYNILINSRRNFFFLFFLSLFSRFLNFFLSCKIYFFCGRGAWKFCCRFRLMLDTNWSWKFFIQSYSLKLKELKRARERWESSREVCWRGNFIQSLRILRSNLSKILSRCTSYSL